MSAWYGVLIDMKIPLVVTIIPGNLNSRIQPKNSYFNSYCPWRQRSVRGNYIVKYALLMTGGPPISRETPKP